MPGLRTRTVSTSEMIGLNRYFANGRTIPDTGPITATMIRTEWNHTGTFRCSADGAAFISKVPNTLIKYSDFRGKSAATGNSGPFPAGEICGGAGKPGGSLGRIDTLYPGVAHECKWSRGGGLTGNCALNYSDGSPMPNWRNRVTSRQIGETMGSLNDQQWAIECVKMGLIEFAPGTWRVTYRLDVSNYRVGPAYNPDRYNGVSFRVYAGSKNNVGSVLHEKKLWSDEGPDGRNNSFDGSANITISSGAPFITIEGAGQSDTYDSMLNTKISNWAFTKIG